MFAGLAVPGTLSNRKALADSVSQASLEARRCWAFALLAVDFCLLLIQNVMSDKHLRWVRQAWSPS